MHAQHYVCIYTTENGETHMGLFRLETSSHTLFLWVLFFTGSLQELRSYITTEHACSTIKYPESGMTTQLPAAGAAAAQNV